DYFQSIYTDQPVVSDPTSYAQVRHRVKQNKAQWGPDCSVYADHVEHVKVGPSRLGTDFASAIGTGAVPGTKLTWPGGPEEVLLTPDKESHWKKWLGLYNTYKLSSGEYINAYDIGFDIPAAHVIKKDGSFYYAFYGKNWNGEVELRGLDPGRYFVRDYVNNTDLESVSGPTARIPVVFDEYLLLECKPAK